MGHSKCGAIKGACSDVKLGNLSGLLDKIKVSVDEVKSEMPGTDSLDPDFVKAVESHNVLHTMDLILENSPVLKELFDAGEIGITGGIYDVDTGEVEFVKNILSEN